MRVSKIFTAPTHYEGVSLSDAKRQLRIHETDNTFEVEIGRLIRSGTQWMERRYGLSIITQTRIQTQDHFYPRRIYQYSRTNYPSRYAIDLLYAPIQSITSVTYVKEDGTTGTLAPITDYYAAGMMSPILGSQDISRGRILPVTSWPATKYVDECVTVKYVCGFGDDSTFVPEPIKDAILRYVSFMFEQRMDEVSDRGVTTAKFHMGIDSLMSTYENFRHVDIEEC